jgi:hypothetical protein
LAVSDDRLVVNQPQPQLHPVRDLAIALFRPRTLPDPVLSSEVRTAFAALAERLSQIMTPGPDAAAALRALHVAYLQARAALPDEAISGSQQ